jgi:hypothetical protein
MFDLWNQAELRGDCPEGDLMRGFLGTFLGQVRTTLPDQSKRLACSLQTHSTRAAFEIGLQGALLAAC